MQEVMRGTLDLLILRVLSIEPMHGWGISDRIRQLSASAFHVNQGSLYPALHRLEKRGWLDSRWGQSSNNREAKFYSLTAAGLRQLDSERDGWRRFSLAVNRVLNGLA